MFHCNESKQHRMVRGRRVAPAAAAPVVPAVPVVPAAAAPPIVPAAGAAPALTVNQLMKAIFIRLGAEAATANAIVDAQKISTPATLLQ